MLYEFLTVSILLIILGVVSNKLNTILEWLGKIDCDIENIIDHLNNEKYEEKDEEPSVTEVPEVPEVPTEIKTSKSK